MSYVEKFAEQAEELEKETAAVARVIGREKYEKSLSYSDDEISN